MKNPWSKWYWRDWLSEHTLRMCSASARGVWIDLLALMSMAEEPGYLIHGGEPYLDDVVARFIGVPCDEYKRCLAELITNGVCSKDDRGVVFSRRMVQDESKRELCSESGKLGGGSPLLTISTDTSEEPRTQNPERYIKVTFKGLSKGDLEKFEQFWNAYNHKIGRGQALRAFSTAIRKTTLDKMLKAIELQHNTRKWIEGYQPHASTWLNGEQWENDIDAMNRTVSRPNQQMLRSTI